MTKEITLSEQLKRMITKAHIMEWSVEAVKGSINKIVLETDKQIADLKAKNERLKKKVNWLKNTQDEREKIMEDTGYDRGLREASKFDNECSNDVYNDGMLKERQRILKELDKWLNTYCTHGYPNDMCPKCVEELKAKLTAEGSVQYSEAKA